MAPILELTRLILAALPQLVFSGWAALLLIVAVALVFLQYRRVSQKETELLGVAKHTPLEQTLTSLIVGAVGGLVGSAVLTWAGVGLVETPGTPPALLYLWPVSILLSLVNPRFICFAYSGTLLSLSYLLVGWPRIDIPSVMGLVAVLHMVEALLIRFSGDTCATPMSVSGQRQEAVPGFTLQRFWPVPLVMPVFSAAAAAPVDMPAWWPLLRPDPAFMAGVAGLGWQLLPVVVTMGYSDLAITAPPGVRTRQSARVLLLYSLVLMALAVGAGHWRPLMWVAAVFSGLGHEAMAVWSGRVQLTGVPYLQRPSRGVGVLDVLPGSPAAAAGLRSGSVILAVEEYEVHSRDQLHEALLASPAYARIVYRSDRFVENARVPRPEGGLLGLGVILLPEPGDAANARVRRPSFFRWAGLEK